VSIVTIEKIVAENTFTVDVVKSFVRNGENGERDSAHSIASVDRSGPLTRSGRLGRTWTPMDAHAGPLTGSIMGPVNRPAPPREHTRRRCGKPSEEWSEDRTGKRMYVPHSISSMSGKSNGRSPCACDTIFVRRLRDLLGSSVDGISNGPS
jgi:hypothetical protein